MKQNLFYFWLMVSLVVSVKAQTTQIMTDSIELQVVEITQSRLQQFHTGQSVQTLDSSILQQSFAQNLADVLEQQSPLFVKTYGLSSLASTNIRGAGSSHTAILWNGFNLQSSMNGILDLSLVPVSTTDNIQIQYGGSSALFGSGAIGGVIHLQNQPTFGQGKSINIAQSLGSFGKHHQSYEVNWSEKKWVSSLQYYHQKATNDFSFTNTTLAAKPSEIQQNAALKQEGILQQNYLRIGGKHQLGLQFWYQTTDRQIPSTMLTAPSKATQSDQFYRTALSWKSVFDNRSIEARMAFLYEDLTYVDSAVNLLSNNHSKAAIAEIEHKWQLSPMLQWQLGFNYTHDYAKTDGYGSIGFSRHRTSMFSALKTHFFAERLKVVLSGRAEMVDSQIFAPIVPALGWEYALNDSFRLNAHFSRNYRLPTFNDLYWEVGGNPNLKAEVAWNQEIGITQRLPIKGIEADILLNVFNSNIKDWILWLPTNKGYYSPSNLQEVWSRGFEGKASVKKQTTNGYWNVNVMYAFTRTTNQKPRYLNDKAVGKQLIYVPLHTVKLGITHSNQYFDIRYFHQLIGKRYTNADNSNSLPIYQLGSIVLAKHCSLGKNKNHPLQLQLKVNNLWNESYQVIAFRAMPLRYWEFGLKIGGKF
ncbi:MAG: TonB-dependent receptor [Chitinophagales bacterium]